MDTSTVFAFSYVRKLIIEYILCLGTILGTRVISLNNIKSLPLETYNLS